MVVDGEGGDLLDQLEEVDGAVEEGGLEFAFEVDVGFAAGWDVSVERVCSRGSCYLRLDLVDVVGKVD